MCILLLSYMHCVSPVVCVQRLGLFHNGMGRENLWPCRKATELQNIEHVNFLDMCRCSCVAAWVFKNLR